MNVIDKVVKADPDRRSRLHDLRGNLLDPRGWTFLPLAVADAFLRLGFARRRAVPWISYRASRTLRGLITRDWRVMEFGSGASTLWLAKRSAFVVSIEGDPAWYRRVETMLRRELRNNVLLMLRPLESIPYSDVADIPDSTFDLAFVDGHFRSACVAACLPKIRPGGYIYIDNTDQAGGGEAAETLLSSRRVASIRYFTDFAPGQAAVTQGVLARLR